MVGLELPIFPVRHEYFITEPISNKDITPDLPVLRIPDSTLYARADVNSLLLGGWEPNGLSIKPSSFQLNSSPPPIEEDWPVLSHFASQLAKFYPKIESVGIHNVFSGWPTFTPDGKFIVGKTSKIEGFIMAGGCNAHGVSGSAGIGFHVLETLTEKTPSDYVMSLSPDRFAVQTPDGQILPEKWPDLEQKSRAVYETYYHVH